jgi:hypothetical protein
VLGNPTGAAANVAATSAPVLGLPGSSVGSIGFANVTSGTVTLQPVTGALGANVMSLPAATDTLVGRATTDTLTNKTLTSPAINGGALTALTGLAIRSTGAAFDITFASNDATLTAGRTINYTVLNGSRNVALGGDFSLGGAFSTSGVNAVTLTSTGTTNVTLPTSGTLLTQSTSLLTTHAGYTASIPQGSTIYMNAFGHESVEANAEAVMPFACTLSNMYVKNSSVGGAAQTVVYTLFKNGGATAVTATVSSGGTTANDTTHSASFAAGDTFSVQAVLSATTGGITGLTANLLMTK